MTTFISLVILLVAAVFIAALIANHLDEKRVAKSAEEPDQTKYVPQYSACDEFNRLLPSLGSPTLFYSDYGDRNFENRNSKSTCACFFEQYKKIWLLSKLVSYDDIEDIYVEEQRFITREKIYDKGSLPTGKLLKRAAVGGLLFGITGAALGAVTTSKDKRCIAVDKSASADYTLTVTIKGTGDVDMLFFEDAVPLLNSWVEKLKEVTGICPRVIRLDDIDTDLVNNYNI